VLFFTLVFVAVYQIVARNLWGGGIGWGDAYVRVAVLWVTVIGAMVASRNDDHIRIDLVARYMSERYRYLLMRLTSAFAAAISGVFAWYAALFVRVEYEYGSMAFGAVPAWVCEAILPVGFAIIALKYALRAVMGPK